MDNKNAEKCVKFFYCEKCDYYAKRKYDYNRHIESKKHNDNNDNKKCVFNCMCGKSYMFASGLSRHKQKCPLKKLTPYITDKNVHFEPDWKLLFQQLAQQNSLILEKNSEMIEKIEDFVNEPKVIHNTIHNNQFNVMNYLNNDCKDAMNLSDFINDFTFSLQDLELLESKGYQKTMEQTFLKKLCSMEKTKRPIHCSDKKRKSFYIKDNDIWEKDENNEKLIVSVKKLASKHFGAINNWRSCNKDWLDNDIKHDFFNKSVLEVAKCDDEKHMNKIIYKLSNLSLR